MRHFPMALAAVLCVALTACSPATPLSDAGAPTSNSAASAPADTSAPASTGGAAAPAAPSASGAAASEMVDCTREKCLALTFDDGPSALTGQLLDALRDKNAKATFFIYGAFIKHHREFLVRAAAEGHEIGSHTMNHPNLKKSSVATVTKELTDAQAAIAEVTGQTPTLLRPPYGATNDAVNAEAGKLGLAVINWNSGPADWENKTQALIERLTVSSAKPGAILLLHDTHPWTVNAMPAAIDQLQAQGYTLVTVSELLGPTQAGVLYP